MYCEDTASARIDLSCFMRCDSAGVRLSRGTPWPTPFVSDVLLSWLDGPVMGIVSQASPEDVGGTFWKTRWDSCSESCDDGVPQGPVAWAPHRTKYRRQLALH